ncbi:MAG: hypothetical protein ACREJ2_16995 [Planctomycetota bacterium]
MTTFDAFPSAAGSSVPFEGLKPYLRPIQARLNAIDRRLRWRRLLICAAVALAGLLAWAVAVSAGDMIWGLSALTRGGLFYTGAAALLSAVAWFGVRPALRAHVSADSARLLDAAYPHLNNNCVSAVQFAEELRTDRLRGWAGLAVATIFDTAQKMDDVDPRRIVAQRRAWQAVGAAAGLLALVAAAFALSGGQGRFQRSMLRVLLPFRYTARVGAVEIADLQPGDKQILKGQDVSITATVAAPPAGSAAQPGAATLSATLFFETRDVAPDGSAGAWSAEQAVPMERDDPVTFSFLLRAVAQPTRYRVEIGGSQAPADRRWCNLSLLNVPEPRLIALVVTPPAYTLKPSKLFAGTPPDVIAVPVNSEILFAVQPSMPLTEGFVLLDDDQRKPLVKSASVDLPPGLRLSRLAPPPGKGPPEVWSVKFAVPRSMRVTVNLVDAAGHVSNNRLSYRIDTIPDMPPSVKFLAPDKDTVAAAGSTVHLVVGASDDYGLKEVRIEYKRNKTGILNTLTTKAYRPQPSANGGPMQAVTRIELPMDWVLNTDNFEQGDELFIDAVASDEFQSTRTPVLKIEVLSSQTLQKAKLDLLDEIVRRLQGLLAEQQDAYGRTKHLPNDKGQIVADKNTVAAARLIRVGQIKILNETKDLADHIQTDDARIVWIRDDLYKLQAGAETAAGGFAERMEVNLTDGQAGGLKIATAMHPQLMAAQIQIMADIKALLQVIPRTRQELEEDIDRQPGSNLNNEVKKSLEQAKDELASKLEEHKKALEISEELAKKNVADFTDKDKADAIKAAALEDDFGKFMEEKKNELSKLTPQDFSDPRLLKEALETYEEVEMAKDALAAKNVEMAVPLEQAGLEGAESLNTNIEKWLPDTPDRTSWKMEEPVGNEQVPMADLPNQLEDIIGDLMENEEDLMQSADDVTSSHADSMDKGAGWDAMDGPISDFSAKGVTGNQLPNSSEINGRSGEGRQGKSSGEFVGQDAVGKGGRKTPTRLTPDQFLKGDINDTSKDPAGGSTGGGKAGGAGGEGLEGPVPPDTQRSMQRLAGAQADLRNKAEKLNLQLRKAGYISPDLDRTIQEMQSAEGDMKDGRYTNLARKQNVILTGLAKSKEFVEGSVKVGNEGDTVAPRKLVDNVMDAMDGTGVPPGYEDVLEGYYARVLNGADAKK